MYSKAVIVLISLLAAVNAGIIPIPSVEVLQGPGSRTTLLGPDGSSLSSGSPGGTVVTNGAASLIPTGPAVLGISPDILVKGPAGSILTSYTAAGPAVVPAILSSAPANLATVIAGPTGIASGDDSGAYVPDGTEQLYDDGSYNEEH